MVRVVFKLSLEPGEGVFGREDLKDGNRRVGDDLLNGQAAIKHRHIGDAESGRSRLDTKFRQNIDVPFFFMPQEPLDDGELPSCVIELSHGAFLYLAIDILRIRLIPRGAQVDFERDLDAHRVFESLIHGDIVVHSSTSGPCLRLTFQTIEPVPAADG